MDTEKVLTKNSLQKLDLQSPMNNAGLKKSFLIPILFLVAVIIITLAIALPIAVSHKRKDNHKRIYKVTNSTSPKNPYEYIKQHADYLFEVQYLAKNIDYNAANTFFKSMSSEINSGGCTGIVKNGKVLRHLDWYYDRNPEFIIRTQLTPKKAFMLLLV